MGLVEIPGGLWIPRPQNNGGADPAFDLRRIDAAAEKAAFVFRVPRTGTLDKFEFNASIGNNPDNGLRCSFQDLDASGDPDGGQDQFRDLTGALSTGWQTPGLLTDDGTDSGVKRSVTAGQYLACVVEFVSFVASDQVDVRTNNNIADAPLGQYADQFTTVWTKSATDQPILALKYNDGTYAYIGDSIYPAAAFNAASFNVSASPDERGLRFMVAHTMRVGGVWFRGNYAGAGTITLYDAVDAVLEAVSLDPVNRGQTGNSNSFVRFSQKITLTPGVVYRLTLKPTGATAVVLLDFDAPSNAHLNAAEGGLEWYYTHRTDAGSWTNTDTKRPWMGLLVTDIQDGTAALALAVSDGLR